MNAPRRHTHRRAQVTVWLLLSIGVIVAILALAMDGGRLLDERRHVQAAADAAALAAAIDLYENYSDNAGMDPANSARDAARASAAANGFSNDGTNSTVEVNVPPSTGDFADKPGFVEVIITSNLESGFSTGLTGGQSQVKARAVASGKPLNVGVLVLAPTGQAFQAKSNATANLTGAPLTVDSSDGRAIRLGWGAVVTADTIAVVGSTDVGSGATLFGTVTTGVIAGPDPLASLAAPSSSNYVVQSAAAASYSSGSVALQPGIYQGGIALSGTAGVTLSSGVYIIEGGGIQISGQATLSANGVLIYNTTDASGNAGPIQFSGQGNVSISAPTSGACRGIALFQDRSVTQTMSITGNGNLEISGLVYASAADVTLTGNAAAGVDLFGTGYISTTLTIQGNGSVQVTPGTNLPKVAKVNLVE